MVVRDKRITLRFVHSQSAKEWAELKARFLATAEDIAYTTEEQ